MKSLTHLLLGTMTLIALTNCGGQMESTAGTATGTDPVVAVKEAPAKPANIVTIKSDTEFDAALKTYADRLVVVDFHAEWCGPCKKLAPELAAVAVANPEAMTVLTVDIDMLPKIADRYQTESIPLLVQIKDGKEVNRKVGSSTRDKLAAWMAMKLAP